MNDMRLESPGAPEPAHEATLDEPAAG